MKSAGKFAHRGAAIEFSQPEGLPDISRGLSDSDTPGQPFQFIPHREAVTEISRGLSVAIPPVKIAITLRTPEGC
jgi:hypothetical protein